MQTKVATVPLRTRVSREELVKEVAPISSWPTPESSAFDSLTHELYCKRCLAVELYVSKTASKDEIKNRTGFSLAKARGLAERCLRKNPSTQQMTGLWACVPGRRLPGESHRRRRGINPAHAEKGQGLKGTLKELFRVHPGIENAMTAFVKNRRLPGKPPVSIINYSTIVAVFHVVCREAGVAAHQWPFNTKKLGANAIYEWWRVTRTLYPMQTIENQFGEAAAKMAATDIAMILSTQAPIDYKAFERVELDEHLVHGIFNIGALNRKRVMTWVDASRFWVLALRDKRSGAVLATSVSYRERYDRNDILKLIRRALMPPAKRALSLNSPEFRYAEGAAFPAELTEFQRNTRMELAWDSDSSHLSLADKGRIEAVVGCRVKSERLEQPTERETIEGLFAGFAKAVEALPVGTGSHPRAPSRRDPEVAAKTHDLYAHHIEEIWDVYCRNLNCRPATRCGGLSPLQFLLDLNIRGEAFVSPLGELGPNNAYKLLPSYPANLTRRRGKHGPLRVQLFGAAYSSADMAFDSRLLYASNLDCQIYVEEDARQAFVVPDAHPEIVFPVSVVNNDLRAFPHSLEWRQIAEAATKTAVTRGKGLGPAVMIGVIDSLGEATLDKVKGASALLAGISGFMAAVGVGSVDYVMSEEERARVVTSVETMASDSDELPSGTAIESRPTATQEPAPIAPSAKKARKEGPANPPTPSPSLDGADEFQPF